MMRTGPARTPRAPTLKHAERQDPSVGTLSSVRYYGPATLLMVEDAGAVRLLTRSTPELPGTVLVLNDLTPGVWHEVPPFTGFSAGGTTGELVVGYR